MEQLFPIDVCIVSCPIFIVVLVVQFGDFAFHQNSLYAPSEQKSANVYYFYIVSAVISRMSCLCVKRVHADSSPLIERDARSYLALHYDYLSCVASYLIFNIDCVYVAACRHLSFHEELRIEPYRGGDVLILIGKRAEPPLRCYAGC